MSAVRCHLLFKYYGKLLTLMESHLLDFLLLSHVAFNRKFSYWASWYWLSLKKSSQVLILHSFDTYRTVSDISIPGFYFKVFNFSYACWLFTDYTKTHCQSCKCSPGILKFWKREKIVKSVSPSCLVWWRCVFFSHEYSFTQAQNLQELIFDVGTIHCPSILRCCAGRLFAGSCINNLVKECEVGLDSVMSGWHYVRSMFDVLIIKGITWTQCGRNFRFKMGKTRFVEFVAQWRWKENSSRRRDVQKNLRHYWRISKMLIWGTTEGYRRC